MPFEVHGREGFNPNPEGYREDEEHRGRVTFV